MNDAYQEAMRWLEEKYNEALNKDDKGEMLTIEWIINTVYFDNDMRNS
jgi:hypothetical protein